MRKLAAIISLGITLATPVAALADRLVSGYVRQDGVVVQPYVRGEPDGLSWNNKR